MGMSNVIKNFDLVRFYLKNVWTTEIVIENLRFYLRYVFLVVITYV